MWKPLRLLVVALLAFSLSAPSAGSAQDAGDTEMPWPLEFEDQGYTVVLYQPQPETFEGNRLTGRMAIEVFSESRAESDFGTAWFDSRVDTDRTDRTATIRDIEVARTYFPDVTPEQAGAYTRILEAFALGRGLEITLDQLLTSISLAERPDLSVADVNNEPPEVIYRDRAAVLVTIDGDPILERIDGTDLMAVVNTAFAILLDLDSGRHFLYAGQDLWYESPAVTGPWEFTASVPPHVSDLIPPPDTDEQELMATAEMPDEPGQPPEIVVATVPSELIATLGNAQFTPIPGTQLMVVGNTASDLLFHTAEQLYYVLLSGRWFRSESLEGPWEYVAADELPETFVDIPPDSEMGSIRIHVGGTEEAQEAVLDAQIPQTAAIDRDDTSLHVEYDGDPVFEPIEGTDLDWAVNTDVQVIEADGRYFAVSDGVWYTSTSSDGVWYVATAVPEEIYDIPPSSPMHNATYVHVYDSTPEVVYVGYTPGYTQTIVHHTTVVHHTGWWWDPWWSTRFIPRTSAWGWHVRWNPWTGWGVGFTWTNGWFTFGIGRTAWRPWCCSTWWGPSGFHRGFHAGRRAGFHSGFWAGYAAGRRRNLYRDRNPGRLAPRDAIERGRPGDLGDRLTARPSTRPNTVLADRDGNVHRRVEGRMEERRAGGWERGSLGDRAAGPGDRAGQIARPPARETPRTGQMQRPALGGQRPQTRAQPTLNRQQELNRTLQSRNRGAARTQQFNQARAGAAGRAGGRRR